MINKFFRTIHNKHFRLFKFIFFLRYLFGIFFIAIAFFLIIPYFFNYENRAKVLTNYLLTDYDFKISRFEKIEFTALPLPKVKFKNALINVGQPEIEMKIEDFAIYPKLLNIYNYENFQSNKITLKQVNISLDSSEIYLLLRKLLNQKNKFSLENLNLMINDKNEPLIRIKNMMFSNFGFKKNTIEGKIFGKKFITEINDKLNNFDFKLINTGIDVNVNFDQKNEQSYTEGIFKSKILSTNLKSDFIFKDKTLNISNLYLRNKNLSLNNESKITFDPFFEIESKTEIEDFNFENFKNLDIEKILVFKNVLKKINFKNELIIIPKKFRFNQIENFNLKTDLAYGRINYSKNFITLNISFSCNGSINLLEEYPLLLFDCNIYSKSKKIFLKNLI